MRKGWGFSSLGTVGYGRLSIGSHDRFSADPACIRAHVWISIFIYLVGLYTEFTDLPTAPHDKNTKKFKYKDTKWSTVYYTRYSAD